MSVVYVGIANAESSGRVKGADDAAQADWLPVHQLPDTAFDHDRILADAIAAGVEAGDFAPCDPWEVANILWTVANGLIQTEHVAPRRQLRRRDLDRVFDDMVELFLRGIARAA